MNLILRCVWGMTLAAPLLLLGATLDSLATKDPLGPAGLLSDPSAQLRSDSRISELQARLRDRPEDWRGYTELGAAYLQKARETGDPSYYTKAEGVLKKALEGQPGDLQAMNLLGVLALARHQFEEAREWGQRVLGESPASAGAYGVVGDAQIGLGRYQEAFINFQKMVDLRPDLSSYARVSYAKELMGDVPAAIEAMERAVRAGGPNFENTAWTRIQLGDLYFSSGDLTRAEAEYRRTLAEYRGYLPALAGIAKVKAAQGRYEEAITLYRQVVEVLPFTEYVVALGDTYWTGGYHQEAWRQYELVRAMQRLYQANGVVTDLEMALFEADRGERLDEALAQARREIELRPSIYAADALAWTLYKTGQCLEALPHAEQALRLGTRNALMLFHRGMIAHCAGYDAEAQFYLREALRTNPYFSLIYRDVAKETLEGLLAPHKEGGTR